MLVGDIESADAESGCLVMAGALALGLAAAPSGKRASSNGGDVSGEVMGGPDKLDAVVAADAVPYGRLP